MLRSLSISNYILIEKLQIEFADGFTTITGETGAGKSILLGALSLVTGERADTALIRNREKKCVVESVFINVKQPGKDFFIQNNIDLLPELILRREILPSGMSRAFINDCPVNLSLLKEAGRAIIDVHSQHQNLLLNNNRFQLGVIDSLAENIKTLDDYISSYTDFIKRKRELSEMLQLQEQSQKDLDYISFQFSQLNDAKLKAGEQDELESEQKILENAGAIIENLGLCTAMLSENPDAIVVRLKELRATAEKLLKHVPQAEQWIKRTESLLVEIRDIAGEMDKVAAQVEVNPGRLEEVSERLNVLYSLLFKHKEKDVDSLIKIRNDYKKRIDEISNYSEGIEKLKSLLEKEEIKLEELAEKLSKRRRHAIPVFGKKMTDMAADLGMPHAKITCSINQLNDFTPYGKDELRFMFTSNPQMAPIEISKAASGGELSRIMLCLKTLLAGANRTPSLIFDEIDTGLSGEIAHKMAVMMKQLASGIQVIAITHLPQIAASGSEHILVYKETEKEESHTHLKKLQGHDRLNEIAKMLSGKKVTPAAIKNAEDMIRQSK